MDFTPHDYQSRIIQFMLDNPQAAIFVDPGLGKTACTLRIVKETDLPTLIVSSIDIIYRVWPREIKKWNISESMKWTILHGPDKLAHFRENCDIYLINSEGLKWLYETVKKERRWPFAILVIDESSMFKNPEAKKLDYISRMRRNFKRRYILSGTPIKSSYLNLWGQYYILDGGYRLFDNYYKYRKHFFYRADYKGYDWQAFPTAEEDIQKIVSDVTIQISGRDHLDLPDIVENDINIPISSTARSQYREMAQKLLLEFEDGQYVKAANAAVKTMRLQTISNGFVYINKKDPSTGKNVIVDVKEIHEAKLDVLESLIQELNGNPLLVGYHYRHDLVMLKRRFPKIPAFATGVAMTEKIKLEKEWNAGKIPVLFAQIHATARGLNLQESGYNIAFYSLTWDWEDYTQLIQRLARQGQSSDRVIVHRLICENSIDGRIIEVLKNRGIMSDDFLSSLNRHIAEAARV